MMGKKKSYESRVEKHPLPPMEEYGFELVDTEYIKGTSTWCLRAYIDKEGGIAVDNCEVISGALSSWLDKGDSIDDSYIPKVGSPGLGRPLKKEKDFIRSMGKDVDVGLYRQPNKQKEFMGVLNTYDKNTVTLTMEDRSQMVSKKADIALIRPMLDSQLDHLHAETWIRG